MDQNQDFQQQNTDNTRQDDQSYIQDPTPQEEYPFVTNGTPDGQEYATPGGMHGYVYSPEEPTRKSGVGKRLMILACAVGCVLLLMGGCLLGAWAARSWEVNLFGGESTDTSYTYEVPGTSNGLVIVDGTQEDEQVVVTPDETQGQQNLLDNSTDETQGDSADVLEGLETNAPAGDAPVDSDMLGDAPASALSATIDKKLPQGNDVDKDGKADVAFDENGNVITSAGSNVLNTATVVAKVAASVVEISTETLVQGDRLGQYITSGAGSGVIIAKEGYIVTNNHVVEGADSIYVRLNNGKQFSATLVGTDEATDIAVLWIDTNGYELTVAKLGSSYDLVAGEDVIAIGNPLGSLGGTVTEGIVSATERYINMDGHVMTLMQVSSPINPGNSGGGLFNMAGELVGVVNAKVSSEEIEGLGFAVPVDVAYDIICELIEYRYVRGRVTTGLTLVDVTSASTAMYYFGTRYTGVYVYESTYSTELQYGDRILTVAGKELAAAEDLVSIIDGYKVGDSVEFVVYRKGEQITVNLVLMEYVPDYVTQVSP